MEFEWDSVKAASNLAKHGISFHLAKRVFLDEFRLETSQGIDDDDEERWQTIGLVDDVELAVAYTVRAEAARIITARKAERYEREQYWNRSV